MGCSGLVVPRRVGSSQTKNEPVSPAPAGRFLTTGPPGKPGTALQIAQGWSFNVLIIYHVLYTRASLVAWTKESACNAMVHSLGWEDPLEKGMATHSSILALRIPEEPGGYSPWSHKESDTTERLTLQLLCTTIETRISKYYFKILKYFYEF